MNDAIWSDRELRTFITRIRDREFDASTDDDEREAFIRQAQTRLVPEAQRRLLAEIGAVTDPHGVAAVAFELLEQESWGKRHTWLMVTTDPWGYLTGLVVDDVRAAYRAAAQPRTDGKKLKGIAKASSRAQLEEALAQDPEEAEGADVANGDGENPAE